VDASLPRWRFGYIGRVGMPEVAAPCGIGGGIGGSGGGGGVPAFGSGGAGGKAGVDPARFVSSLVATGGRVIRRFVVSPVGATGPPVGARVTSTPAVPPLVPGLVKVPPGDGMLEKGPLMAAELAALPVPAAGVPVGVAGVFVRPEGELKLLPVEAPVVGVAGPWGVPAVAAAAGVGGCKPVLGPLLLAAAAAGTPLPAKELPEPAPPVFQPDCV
jgi:hypothetical protein